MFSSASAWLLRPTGCDGGVLIDRLLVETDGGRLPPARAATPSAARSYLGRRTAARGQAGDAAPLARRHRRAGAAGHVAAPRSSSLGMTIERRRRLQRPRAPYPRAADAVARRVPDPRARAARRRRRCGAADGMRGRADAGGARESGRAWPPARSDAGRDHVAKPQRSRARRSGVPSYHRRARAPTSGRDRDPVTRRAVEAAAVVRSITVPLLGAMLPDVAPSDAYGGCVHSR